MKVDNFASPFSSSLQITAISNGISAYSHGLHGIFMSADEFGVVAVDVNYLNVGSDVPNHQIFIC